MLDRFPGAARQRIACVLLLCLTVAGSVVLATVPDGAPVAHARGDGLARTPPMGWNDWNAFRCQVDARLVEQTADVIVASGMKTAGYEYVIVDDCWMAKERDADGRLVPDPQKFPDGIKGVADHVHARGLKFGIYESAGTSTCAGYPGSLGHERVDAQTFADWGVDYLKYDNCAHQDTTKEQSFRRYSAMRDALEATGRPIVYSLCLWGQFDVHTWGSRVGHLWRTTGDILDDWESVKRIVTANAGLARFAKPGGWNDPDMLEVGNGGMTATEYRAHFSLWAMMAAPLIAGTDLRKATPATLAIYLNKDVIAVDQDRQGIQATVVKTDGTHLVFAKPLAGGDVAVALFNAGEAPAQMAVGADLVGLRRAFAYRLQNLWTKKVTETAGAIIATVPAHGVTLFRVARGSRREVAPPATDLSVSAASASPDGAVQIGPGGSAVVATTLTNTGRVPLANARTTLDTPAGWAASPRAATIRRLDTGRSFTRKWSVTPPAGTPAGTYTLRTRARYVWTSPDGARRRGTARASLRAVVP